MAVRTAARGTTLLEAVIAIAVICVGVVSLVGLTALAVRTNALARTRSLSTIYAAGLLGTLSRDIAVTARSPGGSVDSDVPGFVQYLDARGGSSTVVDASFVRRWAIVPWPDDAGLVTIGVDVGPPARGRAVTAGSNPVTHVRLVTVRSRRVP